MQRCWLRILAAMFFWLSALHASSITRKGELWQIDNARLRVTVQPTEGSFTVLDKRCGYVWRQPKTKAVGYRSVARVANPTGIRFSTEIKSRGQKLPLIMRLSVPDVGAELILDIDMPNRARRMPPFAALAPLLLDSDDGALAVADYSNGHLYPLDMQPFPRTFFSGHRLDMPWVGIVDIRKGYGYALILDTSDDCGVRMKEYNVNGRATRAPVVEWWASFRQFRYPRRMRYSFVAEGGYVALAKQYRAYARDLGLIVPFAEKLKKNPNIRRLFGTPDVWGNASLTFARKAKALGVDKMLIHGRTSPTDMTAINKLGYLTSKYDNYTDILPLDKQHPEIDHNHAPLPDHAVLRANGKRQTAWLTFDKRTQFMKRCPALWVPTAKIVIPKELATYPFLGRFIDVTTAEGLYECYDPNHPLNRTQKRECGVALESYVRSLGLVVGGEHGIWWGVPHMDYIEGMMSSNPYFSWPAGHLKHPKSKDQEFTSPWGRKLPPWKQYEKFGIGHQYRVPLWELVFHDCIVSTWYWGDASDWLLDAAPEITPKKDAFNVLYGTIPLLWANAGGSWVKDREVFLRTYRNTCKLHEQIAGEAMITHEFLTTDRAVQRTVFRSGTECVVNFGVEPRKVAVKGEAVVLPQNGFAVRGPKIKQTLALVNGKPVTTIQTSGYWFSDANGTEVTMRAANRDRVFISVQKSKGRVAVRPHLVAPGWDLSTTRVYALDEQGRRVKLVQQQIADGMLALSLSTSGTRLEALCGSQTRAPDLAVVSATIEGLKPTVAQGEDVRIRVAIRNHGFTPVAGTLTAYADQRDTAYALASRGIRLGPNAAQTVRMTVPTRRIDGERMLVIQAKLDGGVELCELNNSASLRIAVTPDWSLWSVAKRMTVDAGPVQRKNEAVVMPIELGPILKAAGLPSAPNLRYLRVAECDAQGRLLRPVPWQFDTKRGGTRRQPKPQEAEGELCWLMPGSTSAGARRHFALLLYAKGTKGGGVLPSARRCWRPETSTVDMQGYIAKFTHGVLTSLAPKVNGKIGPDFLLSLILSSKQTGWGAEQAATVERFAVLRSGPVRCVIRVRKKLKAGVIYDKTYTFYPRRFDVQIDVNKSAGGLYNRAHYRLPGQYVDDKGIRASVDGDGEENRKTYGKNKKPRWYAVLGNGWAHSCIALTPFDHVAYWDGTNMGAIGFVSRQHKGVRMSYVVHGGEADPSFAEVDWRRLTHPVQVRIVE